MYTMVISGTIPLIITQAGSASWFRGALHATCSVDRIAKEFEAWLVQTHHTCTGYMRADRPNATFYGLYSVIRRPQL